MCTGRMIEFHQLVRILNGTDFCAEKVIGGHVMEVDRNYQVINQFTENLILVASG